MRRIKGLILCLLGLVVGSSSFGGLSIGALDKPVAIDGDLADWREKELFGEWNRKEQVVWRDDVWNDTSDLSGKVWMAWDYSYLYLAAEVTDDVFSQNMAGENMYKGDHVFLMLDGNREADREQENFNSDDLHIGLSPGNFKEGGDFLSKKGASEHVWMPEYIEATGVDIASKKLEAGYVVEAAIPWSLIRIDDLGDGKVIGLDVCVGDCDKSDPEMESMMSLLTSPWALRDTGRMVEAVLVGEPATGTEGAGAASKLEEIKIIETETVDVPVGETVTLPFSVDRADSGNKIPVIRFQGRGVWKKLAGCGLVGRLFLNGEAVVFDRFINRPDKVQIMDGRFLTLGSSEQFSLVWSPDYESAHTQESSPYFMPAEPVNAYDFIIDVSKMLRPGENTLSVENKANGTLQYRNVRLEWLDRGEAIKLRRKFGKQVVEPVVVAVPKPLVPPKVSLTESAGIAVSFAGVEERLFRSTHGIPGPVRLGTGDSLDQWKILSRSKDGNGILLQYKDELKLERKIVKRAECVEINDTLTNLTDGDLPVMIRHFCEWPKTTIESLTLNGYKIVAKNGVTKSPANPTMLVEHKSGGALGLVVEDEVFRIHHEAFCTDGKVGFGDSELVLTPGRVYTQKWQIYAVPSADYFDFINSVRRDWDVNFRIEGSFAFIHPSIHTDFSVAQLRRYLRNRSAKYAAIMIYNPAENTVDHGLSFPPRQLEGPVLEMKKELIAKIREAAPEVKVLHYYHSYITTLFDGEKDPLPQERQLDSTGTKMMYSGGNYPVYMPFEGGVYAQRITDIMKRMVEVQGTDGIYWDEFEWSKGLYHYGPQSQWDGWSADIDPRTHRILRRKAAVPLLTESFRKRCVEWLAENNYSLVCNGSPITDWGQDLKIPRFSEMGSLGNIYKTHLYTPIGLGDHRSEKVHQDTVDAQRRFIENGALYYFYKVYLNANAPGIVQWMYPFTPVALGRGYIMGEERILTARPGRFRWNGKKLPVFTVHVVDEAGKETDAEFRVVEKDGFEWIELELPEKHVAAIVKD